jgi:hypothetical protein
MAVEGSYRNGRAARMRQSTVEPLLAGAPVHGSSKRDYLGPSGGVTRASADSRWRQR